MIHALHVSEFKDGPQNKSVLLILPDRLALVTGGWLLTGDLLLSQTKELLLDNPILN